MQMALEAFDSPVLKDPFEQAMKLRLACDALREALAQPQGEPVAWCVHPFDYGVGHAGVYAMTQRPEQVEAWKRKGWEVKQLYTTPPSVEATIEETKEKAAKVSVALLDITYGREPECYTTEAVEQLPEGTYKLYLEQPVSFYEAKNN